MTVTKQEERTILITGAAGALGSELSRAFSAKNFNTVMLDRDVKGLESAWDEIVQAGLKEPYLHPMNLATSGPEQFDELVSAIDSEFGGLTGVVHCAASFRGLMPLDQIPPPQWLEQIQVNLSAAWLLSVSCLPLLNKSSWAFIYFLLDELEKMKSGYWGAYGISKLALSALVHQFRSECVNSSIHIRGVIPGAFASPLRAEAYHSENPGKLDHPSRPAEQICELIDQEPEIEASIVDLSDG